VPWGRLLWLAVPLLGAVELCAHYYFAARAPDERAWAEARSTVAELRRPGDLVIVAPEWADPLARQAFGEELMPLRDVARPDESSYARAIEVSVLGRRAPELRDWPEIERTRHGRFDLRVLRNPAPVTVLFDFVDELEPARASVFEGAPDPANECAWNARARTNTGGLPGPPAFPAQRFACRSGEPYFAGVTIIDDQRYRPRRCIWAHPTPRGPLVIRFRDVPLGRRIRGHAGLPWLIMRDGAGPPVELEVRVGGQSLGKVAQRDVEGWKKFEFETGAAAGGRGDVEFEVRSSSVKDRHYCFHADTR
jgi:hypothetical protein